MKRLRPDASERGRLCCSWHSAPVSRGARWSCVSDACHPERREGSGFEGSAFMDVVLLFPGQGSQKPGMGKDLADAYPAARDVFARTDAALGGHLSKLCFDGP